MILKNFKVFSEKKIYFSAEKPKFERFKNSYYSNRILWYSCYNLVKKSRSETLMNIVLVRTKSANTGKKTHHLRESLCFHIIIITAQNYKIPATTKQLKLANTFPQMSERVDSQIQEELSEIFSKFKTSFKTASNTLRNSHCTTKCKIKI